MNKLTTCLAAALLVMCLFAVYAVGDSGTATDFVRTMLNEVMAIQSDPKLQGRELRSARKDLIQNVIMKDFDFEGMAKRALGPEQWSAMSKSQRSEFGSIFEDLFLGLLLAPRLISLRKNELNTVRRRPARTRPS